MSNRAKRPMETVVLEHASKEKVLKDMREYLDPETRRWYFERGIPLRRGYKRIRGSKLISGPSHLLGRDDLG